jgi:hypothetical protein
MASGYIKIFSASLIIRKMQIKTTMREHLTLITMAIIKNLKINWVLVAHTYNPRYLGG